MWNHAESPNIDISSFIQVLSYAFLKDCIINPEVDEAAPVKLVLEQRLVGDRALIDIPNTLERQVVGLLLKTSVIEPSVIVVIVKKDLLL
jgi:hypothetical protein